MKHTSCSSRILMLLYLHKFCPKIAQLFVRTSLLFISSEKTAILTSALVQYQNLLFIRVYAFKYRVFKLALAYFKIHGYQFFRINWHSKQKTFIFGILSRGDICMDNQLLGCLPYTASTASYLRDAIFLMNQWRKTCLIFQAKMIPLQLESNISLHSMASASFWGQKYISS